MTDLQTFLEILQFTLANTDRSVNENTFNDSIFENATKIYFWTEYMKKEIEIEKFKTQKLNIREAIKSTEPLPNDYQSNTFVHTNKREPSN